MTRQILVGGVPIGGGAPVSIQSMLNTRTTDVEGSLHQIQTLADAGCQIVRLAVPNQEAVEGFRQIAALPEEEAARYLRGEALPAEEGEKGWMPAAVELGGRLYPLGWCKSDGRSRKNHYPKGLRKAGG